MRSRVVFVLVVGWLSLVGSFGFHINDEAELGAAAHNLYRGGLYVDDVPAAYYEQGERDWEPRIGTFQGHGYITETRGMAAVSAPGYALVAAWSSLAGLQSLFVVLAASALAAASWWMLLSRGRLRWAAAGAIAVFGLANLLFVERSDDAVWWAPAAMQLTTMVLVAAGLTALHALLREREQAKAADAMVVIALLGSTISFWAFGQKYHGAELALFCVVAYLRFGARSTLLRHACAYAVAGVAVWIHPKAGGLTLLALAVAETASILSNRPSTRTIAPRAGALALGLLVGLTPYFVENTFYYGSPFLPAYGTIAFRDTTPAEGDGGVGVAVDTGTFLGFLWAQVASRSALAAGWRLPELLWRTWVDPGLLAPDVHVQLGMLMAAPLLALAPLGIALRRPRVLDAFLLAHLGFALLLYSSYAAAPGAGSLDSRYLYVVLPALVVYAARALGARLEQPARELALAASVAVVLLAGVLAAFWLARADYTEQFLVLRRLGLVALATVVVWATLAATPRTRGVVARPLVARPVLALALLPPLLFALQFLVHHPPRTAWLPDGASLEHFLPATDVAARFLDRILGV